MVKTRGRRESENVEDQRGRGGGMAFPFPFPGRGRGGGRRIRFPMPGAGRGRRGGIGIVGILVIFGLMLLLGVDPRVILQGGGGGPASGPSSGSGRINFPDLGIPGMPGTRPARRTTSTGQAARRRPASSASDDLAHFVKVILADTEDVWKAVFAELGRPYRYPTLRLFTNYTQTRCGPGMAAMGPFYCPLDEKVYVDLAFYRQLREQFGAPGDFAQAYVIAHEIGHHVQKLLGIADKVQAARQRMSKRDANALQVRMELQADCLAGVWARRADDAKHILERGDIEEGLRAASAIGDDMIQKRTQGRVVPDAFTHGSSKQRVKWFRRGLDSGDMANCGTFKARDL